MPPLPLVRELLKYSEMASISSTRVSAFVCLGSRSTAGCLVTASDRVSLSADSAGIPPAAGVRRRPLLGQACVHVELCCFCFVPLLITHLDFLLFSLFDAFPL